MGSASSRVVGGTLSGNRNRFFFVSQLSKKEREDGAFSKRALV